MASPSQGLTFLILIIDVAEPELVARSASRRAWLRWCRGPVESEKNLFVPSAECHLIYDCREKKFLISQPLSGGR